MYGNWPHQLQAVWITMPCNTIGSGLIFLISHGYCMQTLRQSAWGKCCNVMLPPHMVQA